MKRKQTSVLDEVPEALRELLPELCAALRGELELAMGSVTAKKGRGADYVRERAHALKGAAMRFGLPGLAEHAALAEQAAAAGKLSLAREALTDFQELLSKVTKACG